MRDYPPPPKQFHSFFSLASIIKLPSNPGADVAYKDLVCTEQDKTNIYELIYSLADNSKFSLLLKQTHIKNLGAQINHVHPLKFLAVAMSTPELKTCFIVIFDDYFKRNGFMDGLGPSLHREAEKRKLDMHLDGFAAEMKVNVEEIKPYFAASDWESLVRYLMST